MKKTGNSLIIKLAFFISALLFLGIISCGGIVPPPAAETYTVTYNGNGNTGGTVPTDAKLYLQGNTVTIPGNTGILTKTGATFVGWNLNSLGTDASYTEGQKLTINTANVVLYAKWTTNPTYTVTYYGNNHTGGAVPVSTTSYEEGSIVTIPGNPGSLTKTGYVFTSWNMNTFGTGTNYTEGQTLIIKKINVVLYAKWTQLPKYSFQYDSNGASGGLLPVGMVEYIEGTAVKIRGNEKNLTKGGSTFVGWSLNKDGSGTTYTQGQIYLIGKLPVLLYAKWSTNTTYTITYNLNGGTGDLPGLGMFYESGANAIIFGQGNISLAGNSFLGWRDNPAGTGTLYEEGQTYLIGTQNVILYAQWTTNPTYTLTYIDTNSESGTVPPAGHYEEGKIVTIPGNPGFLTKEGYSFTGWCQNSDGTGTNYTKDKTITIGTANVILYARWILSNPAGLLFTPNGDSEYSVKPAPTFSGGEVEIPVTFDGKNVTIIEPGSFQGRTNLTGITLTSNITSIGASTFEGCVGLLTISIPASVVSIGDNAFKDCTGLTSINLKPDVTVGLQTIGSNSFENCVKLSTLSIPESVVSIGDNAFKSCSKLEIIDFKPSTSTLQIIGNNTFEGCELLTSLNIPSSVEYILDYTFKGCTGLQVVTVNRSKIIDTKITFAGGSIFSDCAALTNIYVPTDSETFYEADAGWGIYSTIISPIIP